MIRKDLPVAFSADLHALDIKQRPEIRSMRLVAARAHHLFIPGQRKIRRQVNNAAVPRGSFRSIKCVRGVVEMAAGAKVVDIINQLSPVVGSMRTVACGTVLLNRRVA